MGEKEQKQLLTLRQKLGIFFQQKRKNNMIPANLILTILARVVGKKKDQSES